MYVTLSKQWQKKYGGKRNINTYKLLSQISTGNMNIMESNIPDIIAIAEKKNKELRIILQSNMAVEIVSNRSVNVWRGYSEVIQ